MKDPNVMASTMKISVSLARLAVLLGAALVAACSVDTDLDGLSDREEAEYGTNPNLVDTDGDSLTDGEEVLEYSTDPTSVDTDGDGYWDGDEVHEGSDPTNPNSWIYLGGWPFNSNKNSIAGAELADSVGQGDTIGRLIGMDQFGQQVELYDFAGRGVPMILDVSAEWCEPCRDVSSWLAGGPDPTGIEAEYAHIRSAVSEGRLFWITVMEQNNFGDTPDEATVWNWDAAYPNEHVPVLGDPVNSGLMQHLDQASYPNLHTLGEDMTIEYLNDPNLGELDLGALREAAELAAL